MERIIWIIAGLTVLIILIGLVGLIVTKIDRIPNWRKIGWILLWLIGFLLLKLTLWGLYLNYWKSPKGNAVTCSVVIPTTPLGSHEIQLVETWEFIWWSTDGGYYRGQKSGGPYEVRIMQNTSEALWFDVFYQYDGKLQKASFELTWDGRQYAGVWSQASPKDTGNVYLRRVNGAWSGHYTNRDNVSFDCGLQLAAKK